MFISDITPALYATAFIILNCTVMSLTSNVNLQASTTNILGFSLADA